MSEQGQTLNNMLISSLVEGNEKKFRKSLEMGANPIEAIDSEGNCCLIIALKNQLWDIATELVDIINVPVNVRDDKGTSALELSSKNQQLYTKIKNMTINQSINFENNLKNQVVNFQEYFVQQTITQENIEILAQESLTRILNRNAVAALINASGGIVSFKEAIEQLINSIKNKKSSNILAESEISLQEQNKLEISLEEQNKQETLSEIIDYLKTEYLNYYFNDNLKLAFLSCFSQCLEKNFCNKVVEDSTLVDDFGNEIPVFKYEPKI